MGKPLIISCLFLGCAYSSLYGMEEDRQSPSNLSTFLNPRVMQEDAASTDWSKRLWESIDNPQRYFSISDEQDPQSFQRFKEQVIDAYGMRITYMLNQKEYLEYLHSQVKPGMDLEGLHPWFKGFSNKANMAVLDNTPRIYQNNMANFAQLIELVKKNANSYREMFAYFLKMRINYLVDRNVNQSPNGIPDTDRETLLAANSYNQFVAWESITTLRLYDEVLISCYPHLCQEDLDYVNRVLDTKNLLKMDGSLLSFLLGQRQVPCDPTTVIKKMAETLDYLNLQNFHLSPVDMDSDEMNIPILNIQGKIEDTIPEKNHELFHKLKLQLKKAPQVMEEDQTGFLPPSVVKAHRKKARKPLPKAKILPKRGTATIKGEKELPRDTVSHLEKQKEMEFKDIHRFALDQAPLIPQPKVPQTIGEKIAPPSGGWSKQDKNRSKLTAERKHSSLVSLSKEAPRFHPVTQFRPSETIYLSAQANRIRQQVLSLDTPPFTIRYKDVKNLLLEIGIPLERNGGSHAHIKTPGHNLKTIVDLHYGWTDKYGPGAMASLRTLLMNLGLDQDEYVKERREGQSS